MATLSKADKDNLTAEEQRQVLKAKEDWEAAYAAGDQAAMDAAHAAAEKVRNNAYAGGYTGGDAGNSYTSLANKNAYHSTNNYLQNSYSNGYSNLSQADSALLNAQQQAQISALKEQYAAALTQADKDRIHAEAEAIRASAGYTAGADGTGYQVLAANAGGMTAEQMRKWLEDYEAVNYRNGTGLGSGWVNGYSTGMNVRSKANKIRQQMQANELAMANADQATKDQLHQENLALAQLLYDYTGQSKKNTWYNEELGRWETYNSDVGYGTDVSWDYPGVADSHKQYLGYTDADIQKYANDTSLYYNFVDPRTNRLAYDESSGYTGQYAQFVNGPYAQLLTGSHPSNVSMETYLDVTGDGFNDDDVSNITFTPVRDANGNVINKVQPALKNNNAMSDYTNQFTSYVQGGVIQPGLLVAARPSSGAYTHKTGNYARGDDPRYTGGVNRDVAGSTPEDKNNVAGQRDYWEKYGQYSKYNSGNAAGGSASGSSGVGVDHVTDFSNLGGFTSSGTGLGLVGSTGQSSGIPQSSNISAESLNQMYSNVLNMSNSDWSNVDQSREMVDPTIINLRNQYFGNFDPAQIKNSGTSEDSETETDEQTTEPTTGTPSWQGMDWANNSDLKSLYEQYMKNVDMSQFGNFDWSKLKDYWSGSDSDASGNVNPGTGSFDTSKFDMSQIKNWLSSFMGGGSWGGMMGGSSNSGNAGGSGSSGVGNITVPDYSNYVSSYPAGSPEAYLDEMYVAALAAQLAQLQTDYKQNISDLDSTKAEIDRTYTEQKRQTTGTAARDAASWREMANAYGLNSGTIGQAALAQNNQLQSNLNALETAQAAAHTEIERQRTLLAQQFRAAISQALADNDYNKAQALYQEAVRQDELLVQQEQFNANLALQYSQLAADQISSMMSSLSSGLSGSSSGGSSSGSGDGGSYVPSVDPIEEKTGIGEAEYNAFIRGVKERVTYLPRERVEQFLKDNEAIINKMSDEQFDQLSDQLAKIGMGL